MEYRIELFVGIFEIACSQIGFNPKTFTIGVRLLSPSNCGLEATLGSGVAKNCQGSSRTDAEVKRNRLSQKKTRPWPAFDGLEAAGGSWGAEHHQGPSGIDAEVKRNRLSPKKILASAGLRQPLEATRGRDPKTCYQALISGS